VPGQPHPSDIYFAALAVAEEHSYDVFAIEDDGTRYIADPQWNAAWKAAFAAAIAYAYPSMLSAHEAALLRHGWEAALAMDAEHEPVDEPG
jgi:hypothetical protein